MVVGEALAVNL